MLQTIWEQIQYLLGLGLEIGDVNAFQMALRTVLIYVFTLFLVRLGSKRFLSEATAFDVIIGIMLGSIMSRAINGSAPVGPTLGAGAVMVAVHWLLGYLSIQLNWFGPLVKGNPIQVIKDGVIDEQGRRKAGLSTLDLEQAMRLNASLTDFSRVELAYMERNGDISIIPNKSEPRILAVSVEDGVQTVRLKLE